MVLTTEEFEKAYKNLNPEQREAVDSIDGPVMVVAGPGTGKTQILTLRIANILLKTDTRPENILALTFTEAAATNMRKRLATIVGAPAFRVEIKTFHSFCNEILQRFPEYFPRVVGSQAITEVDASGIVEEIILNSREEIALLKPWGDPMLYVGDILRKIEELKREGLTPEKFEEILLQTEKDYKNRSDLIHEKGAYKGRIKSEHLDYFKRIEKNKELALIYKKYQEELFNKRLYDFSDMIMEVLNQLESYKVESRKSEENVLKMILQETHQYILVDEHQDTNNAQNRILEILADFHPNPNVFVVGDHKQAIFRFQGASVENFLYFQTLYPEAKLIELFRNYRSTQEILDVAHSLISSDKSLTAEGSQNAGAKIQVCSFKNESHENFGIVEKIKSLIESGVEKKEIAVIYRTNKEAFGVAEALRKSSIAFTIESDEDLLGDRYVRKFLAILSAIEHYGEDSELARALHIEEVGLDILESFRLMRESRKLGKSMFESLDAKTKEKFELWTRKSKEQELLPFLEYIFRESGIMESALKSKDAEAFLGIERLFEEAKRIVSRERGATLSHFIKYLEILKTHGLFIKRPKKATGADSIRLMTAHKSKGLEFEAVFIIHASEKSFGKSSNRDKLPLINEVYKRVGGKESVDSLSDERRIFYVSLTRAKKSIFISYHECDTDGKELLPSPFIDELREDRKETHQENGDFSFTKMVTDLGTAPQFKEIDKQFVNELFYSEQFSVTALNNYLDCPWKYFYRNLVRIPEVQEKYLLFGTAMHSAVEELFTARAIAKERGTVGEIGKEYLLSAFRKSLDQSILHGREKEEALQKGLKSLAAWYDERHSSWLLPYEVERNIRGVELEGVVLSGKLDKIEFLNNKEVRVTDYKTGKVKSRNEIEGKTKSQAGNGDFKRQLVFYKLLLDLSKDLELDMKTGIIEFLEPNEASKIKWEEFEIGKEEVEALKDTIKSVVKEITNLEFWDRYCDEEKCKYCGYRKLLG